MSDLISLDTVIVRRDNLLTSELSETELALLNVERVLYYGMDETAKAVWDYLDKPRSIVAVCDYLLTQFAVDRETCERETLAFINDAIKDDLVYVVNNAS